MCTRRLKRGMILLLWVCLTLFAGVALAEWTDASAQRAVYGKNAAVAEDNVERVLGQNGIHIDD